MKKIAIIGSGISGLGAAYLLKDKYDLTLYEKNSYFGGHARTFIVKKKLPIDTGFIVFNKNTYPNLIGLFKELNIPFAKSDMSFGVSINQGELEYGSKKAYALFATKT
ncbi:MAG: NAD(P)-binding protein [Gammaproteobacteria bacterium]|nr:NAD(P)-binding protein [Gammaproteobacteria bacterium]